MGLYSGAGHIRETSNIRHNPAPQTRKARPGSAMAPRKPVALPCMIISRRSFTLSASQFEAVVLSSGSAEVLAQAKCMEGVDSCLAKPFVIEQLRQALGRALFGAQRQRAPSADAALHGGLNVRPNGKMPAGEGVG